MRALLLDVGNSRLKWGMAVNGELRRTGKISQQRIRERGMSSLTTRLPRSVDTAMASNVAGATFATRLAGLIGAHCGCDLHFAKAGKQAYGLTNSYSQPRRMGVDRWVAMVGAWHELHTSCVIIDAGTAVTIDAIDSDGRHLGGQILPGLTLMTHSLASGTSDIPATKSQRLERFAGMGMFGSNTADAIRGGALNAVAGAIDRAIKTLRSNAYRPKLVLTGGDASRILSALEVTPLHRPNLVLHGLATMLESRS